MRIWVDADACPGPIREILFRAADRRKVETTFVANRYLRLPASPYLRALQVESGFDIADERIVESVDPGDLVVTADIPLAAQIIEAGAAALNPRGTLYTEENIQDHLARRDLLDELRSTGTITGGPSALNKTHVQSFANSLDRYLTKHAG